MRHFWWLASKRVIALRRQDVLPARLDVAAKGRDEPETCNDDTTHAALQIHQQAQTLAG
jgi:hypothetical protein